MTRPYRIPWLRPFYLWYWRIREVEVLDVGETGGSGKSAPDYAYGKVTGRTPDLTVMTETTESPYVCCGYASAGMAVWVARTGVELKLGATAHPIRSQGGRPHDNGSKASELRNGARDAFGVKLDPLARDEIPGRLRDGYAVVINVDYADLPGWLKVQGGSFGHSCTLYGWREDGDYVGFFDPLWNQGARGAWAPWSSIKPALWADGEHSSTVVKRSAPEPEPEPEPPPPVVAAPCYSDLELRAYADYVSQLAVTMAADAAVVAWFGWLEAPRPTAADRWDVGSWAHPESILDPDDPCAPGAPAAWSRGGILEPVADALEATRTAAVWESTSWRNATWS